MVLKIINSPQRSVSGGGGGGRVKKITACVYYSFSTLPNSLRTIAIQFEHWLSTMKHSKRQPHLENAPSLPSIYFIKFPTLSPTIKRNLLCEENILANMLSGLLPIKVALENKTYKINFLKAASYS